MPSYIITGANRGLGLEFVRQLSAPSTNNVIIASVRSLSNDRSDLENLIKQSSSTKIHVLECDTSSESSIASFAKEVGSVLGGADAKLDFLLANAGVNSVPDQTSLDIKADDLQREIQTNVVGPAKLTEHLQPHLQKGSVVMNMTSGLGSMAVSGSIAPRKCATYSISKAGLNMLTVHQAGDLKNKGVTVICMDPGWVKTRMGGEGAMLEPEESIGGMLKVVHKVGLEESGKFYTYTTKEVPW
ncbi:hypothetical protein MMC25_007386 [Agyrium rufum]|nr:hypothetical protein [Agyrium rufum]